VMTTLNTETSRKLCTKMHQRPSGAMPASTLFSRRSLVGAVGIEPTTTLDFVQVIDLSKC
jgi:hypothetical protein